MAAGEVITGVAMDVEYGDTPASALHVGKWSITKSKEQGQYASNSTGGWRRTVGGVKHWSGSMTVYLHDGEALEWSIEGCKSLAVSMLMTEVPTTIQERSTSAKSAKSSTLTVVIRLPPTSHSVAAAH